MKPGTTVTAVNPKNDRGMRVRRVSRNAQPYTVLPSLSSSVFNSSWNFVGNTLVLLSSPEHSMFSWGRLLTFAFHLSLLLGNFVLLYLLLFSFFFSQASALMPEEIKMKPAQQVRKSSGILHLLFQF